MVPADLSAVSSVLERTECSVVVRKLNNQFPKEKLVLDDYSLYLHPILPIKVDGKGTCIKKFTSCLIGTILIVAFFGKKITQNMQVNAFECHADSKVYQS